MSEVLMLGQPVARRGHKGHGPGSGAGRLSCCRTGLQNSSGSYDVTLMRRAAAAVAHGGAVRRVGKRLR